MPKEKPVLYSDEFISIEENPREPEGHFLTVCGVTTALGHGILEDIARAPLKTSMHMIETVNWMIPYALKEKGIPPERLAYAIVRARLKEVQDFSDYLISQRTKGK